MHRNFRKPIVIAAPKIGLKHPLAVSKLDEFANGTSFKPILSRSFGDSKVKRVVFCSGKVAFDIE
jgi:2-oxoglutarate dehydrogenase complex dehydrogenase (E1) component-like enzyme